jgi:hypothetical protein
MVYINGVCPRWSWAFGFGTFVEEVFNKVEVNTLPDKHALQGRLHWEQYSVDVGAVNAVLQG